MAALRSEYIVAAMPDCGHWTLRCQNCNKDFSLEVMPGEHLVDYVKSYECPHCKHRPNETELRKAMSAWHHVIDFHAKIPR